jgi:hypothetical protein
MQGGSWARTLSRVDEQPTRGDESHLEPGQKRCPFCAEAIQDAAIKCRFCGSDLTPPPNEEVSYWGYAYSLGTSKEPPAYLIWEKNAGTSTPIESRPYNEQGWEEIWNVFSAKEPVQWTNKPDVPTCPHCKCINILRITGGDKFVSALAVGVFALGKMTKSFECINCRYRW